jgi:hypothetical protein
MDPEGWLARVVFYWLGAFEVRPIVQPFSLYRPVLVARFVNTSLPPYSAKGKVVVSSIPASAAGFFPDSVQRNTRFGPRHKDWKDLLSSKTCGASGNNEPYHRLEKNGENNSGCERKNEFDTNTEKKKGCGKKNAVETNGENKNGCGNKNGSNKNGSKKNGLNGVEKEWWNEERIKKERWEKQGSSEEQWVRQEKRREQ